MASSNKSSWSLSEGQSKFVDTYFCDKHVGDTALTETVLKDQPKPNHKGLQALQLDPDRVDLLPGQAQHPARSIDTSLRRIQGRMLDTMGPLGKLWGKLEDIMTGRSKAECDVKKLMRLVEQSVLLLGQANVLTNHNRRPNILTRFLKDSKTATHLLKQNEKPLMGNREFLFGTSFYKALHKRVKGNKHSVEIKRQLECRPGHFQSRRGSGKPSRFQQAGNYSKPFPPGPSFKSGRGGGGGVITTQEAGEPTPAEVAAAVADPGMSICTSGKNLSLPRTSLTVPSPIPHSPPQLTNPSLILTNPLTSVEVLSMEVIETNLLPSLKQLLLEGPACQFPLGGRLQFFHKNWEKITTDHTILETVKGYKIVFTQPPRQWRPVHTPRFSVEESTNLTQEVGKMLTKQAIEECSPLTDQFVGHLFMRPKKNGTFRPVFNLKPLNTFVVYQHFRIEGVQMLTSMIQAHDWMMSIDLKDAYFCVPIAGNIANISGFTGTGSFFNSNPSRLFRTKNIFQAPETSSSSFTQVRREVIDFPGRHHTPESKQQSSVDDRQELHTVAPSKTRICHKLGQIGSDKSTANTSCTVSGLDDRQ